jgi:hypothetical protein
MIVHQQYFLLDNGNILYSTLPVLTTGLKIDRKLDLINEAKEN